MNHRPRSSDIIKRKASAGAFERPRRVQAIQHLTTKVIDTLEGPITVPWWVSIKRTDLG